MRVFSQESTYVVLLLAFAPKKVKPNFTRHQQRAEMYIHKNTLFLILARGFLNCSENEEIKKSSLFTSTGL